ncbi:MAG TPA: hypothetical protein VG222_14200 [Vicinamibacterales bacterium]|nr:hypothetical protein [Vicinamibacterales bacterium]
MNYGRLALAAVVATIVDGVYGFIVYGNLLTAQFAAYPGVYRPAETQGPFMAYLFGGIFLAMLAASWIYAKGYEGGSGLMEGARFGVLVGILEVGYSVIVTYAITNIGRRLTGSIAAASLLEWILAGIVIGLVYKPAFASAGRRAPGV